MKNVVEVLGRAMEAVGRRLAAESVGWFHGRSVRSISTGTPALDAALGSGGLPCGRLVECVSAEPSDETALALQVIASAQASGGAAAFIDAEHMLDANGARRLGVNLHDLVVSQPACGEEALAICEWLAKSGAVDVVVVDSVAALAPRAELEGVADDAPARLQARLLSQALHKLAVSLACSGTLCIFTNGRGKSANAVAERGPSRYVDVLEPYASCRLQVRRRNATADGRDWIAGDRLCVRIVKNRMRARAA